MENLLKSEINNLINGEIINDFHSSSTNKEFKERQLYAREVWEKYLSKEGFTEKLSLLINDIK